MNAPEVACIAKTRKGSCKPGKVHKQCEFGVKVGVVLTSGESFVIGAKSLAGNPYDERTLQAWLEQAQRVSHVAPTEVYADRGYRGHGCTTANLNVWIAGAKRGVTKAIHTKLKRRNAVEPVIGHMKSDGA